MDPIYIKWHQQYFLCHRKNKTIFKVGTITTFILQSNTKTSCDSFWELEEGTTPSPLVASGHSEFIWQHIMRRRKSMSAGGVVCIHHGNLKMQYRKKTSKHLCCPETLELCWRKQQKCRQAFASWDTASHHFYWASCCFSGNFLGVVNKRRKTLTNKLQSE